MQFLEFAAQVERALAPQGFRRSDDLTAADVAISITYGIGEPNKQVAGYSTTQGTMPAYSPYAPVFSKATTTAQYVTTYDRFVTLTAYDLVEFRNTNKAKILWEIKMASTGTNGDLRQVFPIMIATGRPYIGKDTGKIVNTKISEDAPSVLEIKGGFKN